jgi:ubiquinone/menaquinone biosynthesis C-methylase UbiE
MSFYASRVLPWLIDRGMRNSTMTRYRPRMPAQASGRVLELGVGAGLNLPYYTAAVSHLFALEPADALRDKAAGLADAMPFPVTLLGGGAESIPLDSASLDAVVSTWTLCSIPDLPAALGEVRRVLKPGGRLLFLEHGRSPDADVARQQDRFAPALLCLAGCNPNRAIDEAITGAGFHISTIERTYIEGPRFLAYHFIGAAEPR